MRVLLDDSECRELEARTVGQAIAAAAALAERQGRMIVEVVVDGAAWSGEQLDDAGDEDGPAQEVRLTSADPVELVCQTFGDAAAALGDADALQQSAAELLQSDQSAAAMERLNEALSIWKSVQQALVMGSQLAEIDLEAAPAAPRLSTDFADHTDRAGTAMSSFSSAPSAKSVDPPFPPAAAPRPVSAVIDDLNVHLKTIRAALEIKDTSALADTLLYDLPPVVRQWQDMLAGLQSQLLGRGHEDA